MDDALDTALRYFSEAEAQIRKPSAGLPVTQDELLSLLGTHKKVPAKGLDALAKRLVYLCVGGRRTLTCDQIRVCFEHNTASGTCFFDKEAALSLIRSEVLFVTTLWEYISNPENVDSANTWSPTAEGHESFEYEMWCLQKAT